MPAKIFTWYVIEGKVNFSEYVHDKVLTISDVNAKIDVRELASFL